MQVNKKHILIVEDEILIAKQLKNTIIKHGYECSGIAINFKAAEFLLKTTTVDLVLLDIKISGKKTGLDIAEMINKLFGIPFLFLTSFNDSETLTKIKELAPKGYINKPINNATLITTVDLFFESVLDKTAKFASINIGNTTYNIHLSELLYVEAEHVYVRLRYTEKSTLIRSSLTSFLAQMPKESLIQISRGVAVNPLFIDKVEATVVSIMGKKLKLSKMYKNSLLNYL